MDRRALAGGGYVSRLFFWFSFYAQDAESACMLRGLFVFRAAYHFRLYLEYARLLNRDKEGTHDFVLE